MTSRASCSASPARAPSAMPRIAPPRRSPKESRPGWRRSSSPAPDPSVIRRAREARTRNLDQLHLDSGSTRRRVSRNDNESLTVVALRGKDVDTFLARPDPGRPIILLYGPDSGLVRERAEALLASAVDDPNDPFSLVRLDGDELSADPSRLVDEAMTVPLFGGRRAIRVRAGSRSFASGVDTLADVALKDCRIVIEAGERDLAKLIDDELRVSNLRIAADARAVLMALLGGDRQASRNELRKLALYAHGEAEVTLEDVMAVVADASELKVDPIVDGAFAGKPDLVETEFAKAMVAGTYPGMIISAAQRQAAWLHKSALAVAEGTPLSTLLDSGFPRLHFSRKGNVETALRNFSAARLLLIIEQLAAAALETRKQAPLAAAIAQRTLLSIAANAKRRG